MFRWTILSILCLGLLGCQSGRKAEDKKRAKLHFQVGTGHLTKGNNPQALRELLRASRLDPSHPQIQNNLGLAYMVRGKYDKATFHIERAIKLDAGYTDARNNLGRILIEQGYFDEAVEVLEVASRDLTYPAPQKIWANLGLAQYRQIQYEEALKSLAKSLSLDRRNCTTYNLYSRTLYELKDFEKAAESFDQAIRLCKKRKLEEPHFYGALSYQKIGREQEAIARLEEVIKYFPKGKYAGKAKNILSALQR